MTFSFPSVKENASFTDLDIALMPYLPINCRTGEINDAGSRETGCNQLHGKVI